MATAIEVREEVRVGDDAQDLSYCIPLREALVEGPNGTVQRLGVDRTARTARCILITEGLGNLRDRNYYSRQAVESAASAFEGRHFFVDHPTASDETERPERSIRDLAGYFYDCRVGNVPDPETQEPLAACFATLKFSESDAGNLAMSQVSTALEYQTQFPNSKTTYAGISINAAGLGEPGEIDGMPVRIVQEIQHAFSADIVTKPARGGRFLQLMKESEIATLSDAQRSKRAQGGAMAATSTAKTPEKKTTVAAAPVAKTAKKPVRTAVREDETGVLTKEAGFPFGKTGDGGDEGGDEKDTKPEKAEGGDDGGGDEGNGENGENGDENSMIGQEPSFDQLLAPLNEKLQAFGKGMAKMGGMHPQDLIQDITKDLAALMAMIQKGAVAAAPAAPGAGIPEPGPMMGDPMAAPPAAPVGEQSAMGAAPAAAAPAMMSEASEHDVSETEEHEMTEAADDDVPEGQAMRFSCAHCGESNDVIPEKGYSLVKTTEAERPGPTPDEIALRETVSRLETSLTSKQRALTAKEGRFMEANEKLRVTLQENEKLRTDLAKSRARVEAYERRDKAAEKLREAEVPGDLLTVADLLAYEPHQWDSEIGKAKRVQAREAKLLEGGAGEHVPAGAPGRNGGSSVDAAIAKFNAGYGR